MVLKNEDYKPLWYFSVQIDHIIEARRTHVVARQNWGYGAGKDRKISRSSQGAAENLECKSAGYTISCRFVRRFAQEFEKRLKNIGITVEIRQLQTTRF